jgi:hypothetical protein
MTLRTILNEWFKYFVLKQIYIYIYITYDTRWLIQKNEPNLNPRSLTQEASAKQIFLCFVFITRPAPLVSRPTHSPRNG